MTKFKKIMVFLLSAVMLGSALASCGGTPAQTQEPEQTEAPIVSESQGETENESETEPEVVTPELEDIIIKVEDLEKYRLIVPDEAGLDIKTEVNCFYCDLRDKLAPQMEYRSDLVVPGYPMYSEAEYEIILSVCARDASIEAASELGYYDYTYKAVGTKLLICAISIDALKMAIKDFKENVVDMAHADKDAVFFNNKEQAKTVIYDYKAPSLMLDGTPIEQYTIIYPSANKNNEKHTAQMLRDNIAAYTGCYLEVLTDNEQKQASGKEIHVGITNRDETFASTLALNEGEAYIGKSGEDFVVFLGGNALDTYVGMYAFASWMGAQDGKSGLDYKPADIGRFNVLMNETVSLMTYNVQMWAPTIEGKPEATMQVIIDKAPDLFGVQEATPAWMVILKETFGAEYGCVGIGRNGLDNASPEYSEDVSNQYCAIFYKKDKFTLVEGGTKWLSLTPDEVSKVEESRAYRAFTYAILERKSDGKKFCVVNTHLDHIGGQDKQMCILANYINEHFSEYPMLIIGDFNTSAGSERYKVMPAAGYADGKKAAAVKINNNVGTAPSGNEIDFCFGSYQSICFEKYQVISDKTFSGETPSDHYALYLEFSFLK